MENMSSIGVQASSRRPTRTSPNTAIPETRTMMWVYTEQVANPKAWKDWKLSKTKPENEMQILGHYISWHPDFHAFSPYQPAGGFLFKTGGCRKLGRLAKLIAQHGDRKLYHTAEKKRQICLVLCDRYVEVLDRLAEQRHHCGHTDPTSWSYQVVEFLKSHHRSPEDWVAHVFDNTPYFDNASTTALNAEASTDGANSGAPFGNDITLFDFDAPFGQDVHGQPLPMSEHNKRACTIVFSRNGRRMPSRKKDSSVTWDQVFGNPNTDKAGNKKVSAHELIPYRGDDEAFAITANALGYVMRDHRRHDTGMGTFDLKGWTGSEYHSHNGQIRRRPLNPAFESWDMNTQRTYANRIATGDIGAARVPTPRRT